MKILLVSTLLIGFVGCASKTVTPGTTPPQVQVASLSKVLADSLRTTNQSLIALRNAGKVTPAEVTKVQNYIVVAATTGKAMDAELATADAWEAQRTKIISLWTQTGLGQAKANLGPDAGTLLDTIITIVNQILTAVGGPSI